MTLLRFAGPGPAKPAADPGDAKRAVDRRRETRTSREREVPSGGVGDTLRAARRGMGVSLEDAAAKTHLRKTYLTALEDDNVEALGLDPAYVRGTLRSYADYLGLDATSLLARYRANGAHAPATVEGDQAVWHQLTRIVGGVVGLIIIAVVAFAAGGMLAQRSVLPVAGEQEAFREHALAPSALRLEFVEETWVRVTTDDQTVVSPPYSGEALDEQVRAARVGAAESAPNREWYGPVRQDRRRSVTVVCDAAFRCRIDQ